METKVKDILANENENLQALGPICYLGEEAEQTETKRQKLLFFLGWEKKIVFIHSL